MANYLNIPKEIIIGKKNNQGFVTYKQGSKLAKEISFKNWLGKGEQIEITNSPTKGFILQDCVGGHGGSWYSYERRAWAIIKDPRGFNIEITFDNLVWIMKMVSHDHNTGFIGEFVYGWDGAQLMLVPTVSEDYKYTSTIDNKESYKLKDLTIGETYRFPNEHNMIYLGYLPIIKLKDNNMRYTCNDNFNIEYTIKKFHCFYCPYDSYRKFITLSSTKKKIIKDIDKPTQTIEWIDNKIKEMNDYLWNNEQVGDISNLDKIIPNPKNTHKNIDKLIRYCELPYVEKKNKSGYIQTNLTEYNYNGIGNSAILLFDDNYSSVTKYYLHGVLLLDNQEEKEWIDAKIKSEKIPFMTPGYYLRIDELRIKFKKEFRDNAKRTILAYRSNTWRIEDNKIMVTNYEDFYKQNFVNTIELIKKNENRIALTKHYTDNFFDIFCVETKDGFVFQVRN